MNCTRYRQLISRYVDDEVTPRQRRDLLAHVQVCRDCAAWLARARQTDVLLKSVDETRPSDSVRNAILSQLRTDSGREQAEGSKQKTANKRPSHTPFSALRTFFSAILLRFDLSPRRLALSFFPIVFASLGILFWFNILPQFWSNKLGFEVQPDTVGIESTPISISAVSSSGNGADDTNSPSLVLAQPGDGAQVSLLNSPVVMRFSMPMDRGSVEDSLLIAPPVAGALSWDADNELRWTPGGAGLLRGITYTVSLSGTAMSLAGTPLHGVSSWSFRTSDPHLVTSSPSGGSSISPTGSIVLTFDTPMRVDNAQADVSVRESGSGQDIPATLAWDAEGKSLAIKPLRPLSEGYVSIGVDAAALTQSGETLGRSYQFKYHSEMPSQRVRLLNGRIITAQAEDLTSIGYEAVDGNNRNAFDDISFDVYAFPAERLSSLGAQASVWPQALPDGLPASLGLVTTSTSQPGSGSSGDASLPALPAGIYLLVAHGVLAVQSDSTDSALTDWQLLLVSDRKLRSAGTGMPLWALNEDGHAWVDAEVSLYSAEGTLLDKGPTDKTGLYSPTKAARGATLAIARDPFGHIASLVLDSTFAPRSDNVIDSLSTNLLTDRAAYSPGDTVNFHATIGIELRGAGDEARLAEPSSNSVTAQLLTPQGYLVSTLSLKPDSSGGVSGLFTLASSALPGSYTIRMIWGDASHDFPLDVLPSDVDTLSVAVLPAAADSEATTITRTVSVLGPTGRPQAGALITGTLGILGDPWTSTPVTVTANNAGIATFVLPLPGWLARFNEPGLFFRAEAISGGVRGSSTSSLDFTSQHSAASGLTQAVAPLQNLAVVARLLASQQPDSEADFKVRAVLLDPSVMSGDILLIARSPVGELMSYSLDLVSLPSGDGTITLPLRFAGGTISILSPDAPAARTISLVPAGGGVATLRVHSPVTATASSEIPIRLNLGDPTGAGIAGNVTLVWRRVSGAPSDLSTGWAPGIAITSSGEITLNVQAPSSPGLWYFNAEANTDGGTVRGWTAVSVLPAPWVQLPPAISTVAGEGSSFTVRIFNPGSETLYTGLRARDSAENSGAKQVVVLADGWTDQQWQLTAGKPGDSLMTFSLVPGDGGVIGTWPLAISYRPNLNTTYTYTSGSITGERNVGVAVPWDISSKDISLEIRASTSILSSLAEAARDLQSGWTSPLESVSMAAAQLSAGAPVASAYARSGENVPDSVLPSGVERSMLLQQLYSAQREDGSWSNSLKGDGVGSATQTAAVLLALYRSSYYPYGDGQSLQPDATVTEHATHFLSTQLSLPLAANVTAGDLNERAYALYAYSHYRAIPDDWVRPLLAYTLPGSTGVAGSLSIDGQAYLALALMQSGRTGDALALLDTTLRLQPTGEVPTSAPMLLALLQAEADAPANGQLFAASYAAIRNPQSTIRDPQYVQALMAARNGAGWYTPLVTADAIWALSLYAALEQERPRSDTPSLLLGDRPIMPGTIPDIPGQLSIILPGDTLRAGTNWLKLRSPASGEPLYYSLTLIATR